MSDYDYGPLLTYEITWRSGHVETVKAHQVTWPQSGLFIGFGGVGVRADAQGRPRVLFHGQIDGKWRLVLSAEEEDIRTVREVTADEPLPS